jgi:hypothetical protein
MAYDPIGTKPDDQRPEWRQRDDLGVNDPERIIKAADFDTEFNNIKAEFDRISNSQHASELASCKTSDGETVNYGFNVASVAPQGSGIWRVTFETPINDDEGITLPDGSVANPGDFAAVVTPVAKEGFMYIASIADQREAYVDIVFRRLEGSTWTAPTTVGFAFILINQNVN